MKKTKRTRRKNTSLIIRFFDAFIALMKWMYKTEVATWKFIKSLFYRGRSLNKTLVRERSWIKFLGTLLMTYMFFSIVFFMYMYEQIKQPLISPLGEVQASEATGSAYVTIIDKEVVKKESIDTWVAEFVDEYFESNTQRSEARMIMHCLLHRESGHRELGENDAHGDGGRAGGILQFHENTWIVFRKLMLNAGLVNEIGSRYDAKEAIRTTVWAIKNNRSLAWGPILRESKGNDFAACPVPSWQE